MGGAERTILDDVPGGGSMAIARSRPDAPAAVPSAPRTSSRASDGARPYQQVRRSGENGLRLGPGDETHHLATVLECCTTSD